MLSDNFSLTQDRCISYFDIHTIFSACRLLTSYANSNAFKLLVVQRAEINHVGGAFFTIIYIMLLCDKA